MYSICVAYNLAIVVWFSYAFRESPARVAEAELVRSAPLGTRP